MNTQSKRLDQARLQGSARQTEHPTMPAHNYVRDLPNLDSSMTNHVTYKPWFVGLDTWTIENKGATTCRFSSGPLYGSPQLGDWTRSLRQWLRQWVDESSNPFIHKQLYFDTGLPLCLEDAWTTLTAYFSKTALNKHLVMQIIEHRVDALLQSQPRDDISFMGVSSLQTIQHLARVQALFIYQYLQICDGSIRHRAMAERYIPTLMQWCEYLWQSATLDSVLNEQFLTTTDPNEPDAMAETLASKHWKAWILSESLRRTWIVCTTTIAAYLRERDGWNECAGEVRYTACQGLWDASSSASWLELGSKQDPLFVRSLHVDELLSNVTPTKVDSFSAALMRLLIEKDKMESWGYK
ncbi:RNA polymerase ii mediator complex component [Fusarium beomiforme]|uniref:RNA polymerase ii mediator complex component n=1 Tax=Fusarium beomiforme TaxID=44412 RepID=A0A9P5DUJ2_9HYPO|nr:RNA polymerase ii mediator complex component [Fusarium beomiforme]